MPVFVFLIINGLELLAAGFWVRAKLQKERRQQEKILAQSRERLIHKLRPHFIFNCLTAIGARCLTNPEEADTAVVEFSTYMRTLFRLLGGIETTSFEQELANIRNYFNLEQLRFGEKLQLVLDVKTTEFDVPLLGVQQFVENAVKHGISKRVEGGYVLLGVSRRKHAGKTEVEIVVEDNGIGFDTKLLEDETACDGIVELRERFSRSCGGIVEIESRIGAGTTVRIRITV